MIGILKAVPFTLKASSLKHIQHTHNMRTFFLILNGHPILRNMDTLVKVLAFKGLGRPR